MHAVRSIASLEPDILAIQMITLENESSRHRKAVALVKGGITPAIRKVILQTLSNLGDALGPQASLQFLNGGVTAGVNGRLPEGILPDELAEILRPLASDEAILALADEVGRSYPEVPIHLWPDISGEDVEVYTQRTQMEDLTRGFRM